MLMIAEQGKVCQIGKVCLKIKSLSVCMALFCRLNFSRSEDPMHGSSLHGKDFTYGNTSLTLDGLQGDQAYYDRELLRIIL